VNAIAAAAPEEASAVPATAAHVGAASFSDLVRAHFLREHERIDHGSASRETETEFHHKLERFEHDEGKLAAIYWSTRTASAVAMTIGKPRSGRNPIAETEMQIRLHRVTDWLVKDQSLLANVLHDCDLLAIRAGEILRGTSERIAMRWIFSVQEHVLGYIEREDAPTAEKERDFVAGQRRELARIEEYYFRAAAKAGRIVYVTGMLAGAVAIAATTTIVAVLLSHYSRHWDRGIEVLLLCTAAGAVGALVSVLSRMSGGSDKFSVDFEVGRPLLRRLGLYKPLVGSVFGVALYFMLASGLLMTKPPTGHAIFFYGAIAFLAGFSERFTGVIFGDVQRLVTGEGDGTNEHAEPAAKEGRQ
jgi:hypothetical protein